MFKKVLFGALFFASLALLIWASDRVTFQGERTVFTVDCVPDIWQGLRCTGKLVAGDLRTRGCRRERKGDCECQRTSELENRFHVISFRFDQ